jgi:hypothetical protein
MRYRTRVMILATVMPTRYMKVTPMENMVLGSWSPEAFDYKFDKAPKGLPGLFSELLRGGGGSGDDPFKYVQGTLSIRFITSLLTRQ